MMLTDTTYVPDGADVERALVRTTHLAVAAHHDDLEILAIEGILRCLDDPEQWFCGVVMTDGGGAPRTGSYADFSDDEMRRVRRREQEEAAALGRYGSVVLLDRPSETAKDPRAEAVAGDLAELLTIARPRTVYTHNLADKHDTHVAVALRTIEAIRRLPRESRPRRLYGCEVWRDLDWLVEDDKVTVDVSEQEDLQAELLRVFDSQVGGGKSYDRAVLGRRRAHATFHASHAVDAASLMAYAMDLTPLIEDEQLDPSRFVTCHLERFKHDVTSRIRQMSGDFRSK